MTTTILHVEDNEFLVGAVQSAFEAFGFSGRFLGASTLRQQNGFWPNHNNGSIWSWLTWSYPTVPDST
jgi:hypothetical protein